MKNRRRRGGAFRLFIFVFALVLVVFGIRLAVNKILSGRAETEAAEQISSTESGSAADSAALEQNVSSVSIFTGEGKTGEGAASDANTSDAVPAESDTISAEEGATTAAAAMPEKEEPAYDHTTTELENGREYLAALEERTPAEMAYMIAEARKEHEKELVREQYQKKREAYLANLEGDSVWDAFDDYVFLGDSRVVGFDVFGFLPSDRILAEAGDTINSITDRMETIKSISPKYIFISYGINDIGIGFWPTKEDYATAFSEKIRILQKELPDAEIYVNSIIPAQEDAVSQYPVWGGLPEYSEAVRQMCEKEGISFIDNQGILEEHEDLYASDGVHMQSDFYRYWAENQLLGIFDRENGLLTF